MHHQEQQLYPSPVAGGRGPSVVRFVPPLVLMEDEIDEALSRFEKAIAKRVG